MLLVFAFKLWAEVLACDGGLPPDLFLDAEFLLLSLNMASVSEEIRSSGLSIMLEIL